MIKGLSMNSVVCTRRFLQGTAMFNNQYNNKIPKAINTITNYRKPISATYTRTKTSHKHRGICCLLSLVKTCLIIHYSIIFNLTTVNVPRIENIIFLICKRRPLLFVAYDI